MANFQTRLPIVMGGGAESMCNQITFKFLGNISFMHLTKFHKSEK